MTKTITLFAAVLLLCLLAQAQTKNVSVSYDGQNFNIANATGRQIFGYVLRGETSKGRPITFNEITIRNPIGPTYSVAGMMGMLIDGESISKVAGSFQVDSAILEDLSVIGPDKSKMFGTLDAKIQTLASVAQSLASSGTADEISNALAKLKTLAQSDASINMGSLDTFTARSVAKELIMVYQDGGDAKSLARKYSKLGHLHSQPVAYVTDFNNVGYNNVFTYTNTLYFGLGAYVGFTATCLFSPTQDISYSQQALSCNNSNKGTDWNMQQSFNHEAGNNYARQNGTGNVHNTGTARWDYQIDVDCDQGDHVNWWTYNGC